MRRPMSSWLVLALLLAAACEKKTPAAGSEARGGARVKPGPPDGALFARAPAVLLGEVGSLTGAQASFGISSRNGFDLALREINAAGGVKGHTLVVRVYDSQGRPEEAAQAATRLITRDQVLLLLGEVSSSSSMAMAEKAQAAGVPMITHAATHPAVTQKGDYIFRICFIDPFQGYVMAKFARENLHLDAVAILEDNKNDYSVGLREVFAREFTRMGGRVLATQSYSQGDTDFRAQLTALRKTRPQALYVPGYYTDVGLIARQARELGLTLPLLGSDGWDSQKLFELAGDALEGSYFSNPYALDSPEPAMRQFVANYKAAYGLMPDTTSVQGYEAIKVAVAALERARDWSGPALRDALARTRDVPGVAGPITLDEHRNAVKPAVILQVTRGHSAFVTTIAPP